MAEFITITSGANSTPPDGTKVSIDATSSGAVQLVKLTLSADGSDTHLQADADGLLVNLGANNDVTVTSGTITLAAGTANVGDVDVLTVPAPLSTTGGGTEAAALRVTLANDSTGVISIDDNGGSLTVDGTVAATQSGTWTVQPGNTANTTAWLVTGTGGTFPVTDSGSSLTVDNAALAVVGGGLEATALRVTLASDSTGIISVDDNGGSLTVDGTVTANLAAGTNNIGDVDVLTVPAPLSTTGGGTEATALRVTLANDSTGLVSVDDNGASLTVDAPVGTPVNVQVGDGTRTATVRDTGTSDSLNVAIVDASGNQITSFGGGTEYTEDAAAAADPVGPALNLIRADTLSATTVSADGDNIAARAASTGAQYVELTAGTTKLGNSTDGLLVNLGANNDVVITSGTVSISSGTVDTELPTAVAVGGGLTPSASPSVISYGYVFDGGTQWNRTREAATDIAGTGLVGAGLMAQLDDVSTGTVTENNFGVLRMSSRRNLYYENGWTALSSVSWTNATSLNTNHDIDVRGLGSAVIQVDEQSISGGQIDFYLSQDGTIFHSHAPIKINARSGNPDGSSHIAGAGDQLYGFNVAGIKTLRARLTSTITSGTMVVASWASAASPGNGVAYVVPGTLTGAFDTFSTTSGDVAHDAADSGSPVKIGGKAATSVPTAVAAADRVNGFFDVHGRLHTRSGHQSVVPWTQTHLPAANTQATASKAAAGSGVRNVCTAFTVTISGGSTAPAAVQLNVSLIDGASGGGTYLWRSTIALPAVAGATTGIALSNLWYVGTANTALTLEFSAAGGANTIESVTMTGITLSE